MHTFHVKENKIKLIKNGVSETKLKWVDMRFRFSLEVELMKISYELGMKGWQKKKETRVISGCLALVTE